MAGTLTGGKKAAETNREKHGKNFYQVIGALGGKKGTTGGFYANKDIARTAGSTGGKRSIRGWKLIKKDGESYTYQNKKTDQLMTINFGDKYNYGS